MFFSVIVPIYKVERYLQETIESVLSQTFKDFELILVDDGSPDQCPIICDTYSEKYQFIKTIHKKNGGVSDARNCGMENAQGEYFIFLDGDDLLEKDSLNKIYVNLRHNSFPEMLLYNYNCFGKREATKTADIPNMDSEHGDSFYDFMKVCILETGGVSWNVWQLAIKTEFVKNNNLFFDVNIVVAEDLEWMMRVMELTSSFLTINERLIQYRVGREGSAIATPSYNAIKNQLDVLSDCYWKFREKYSAEDVLAKYFAMRYTNIIILISHLNNIDEIQNCLSIIKANKEVIKKSPFTIKYVIPRIVWCCLGYYKGSLLLERIKGIKK